MIKKITCLSLALCVLCINSEASADDQTTLRNTIRWNVTDAVRVWSSQEYRNRGYSLYNEPFSKFLELGVRYRASANIFASLGYRHRWIDSGGATIIEDRWIAALEAITVPADHAALSARLRFDGKYFDNGDVRDYIWYRFRLKPSYEMHLKKLQLNPFVAVEIFGDTRPESKIFINRNRIYVGTTAALGKHFNPRIEYMREDVHDDSTDHAIRLMLIWTIQ